MYVYDDDMQPVPDGTVGNLWIGGAGLSPGARSYKAYQCSDIASWRGLNNSAHLARTPSSLCCAPTELPFQGSVLAGHTQAADGPDFAGSQQMRTASLQVLLIDHVFCKAHPSLLRLRCLDRQDQTRCLGNFSTAAYRLSCSTALHLMCCWQRALIFQCFYGNACRLATQTR